jgi:peptide/nickel transport system permease protein
MSMAKYIIRRVLALIPILVGVIFTTFILSRLMPGDPCLSLMPDQNSQSTLAAYYACRDNLGIDDPIWRQMLIYYGNLLRGDWGVSYQPPHIGIPVWNIIREYIGVTLELTIITLIFSSLIGIKTGIISAVHRNKTRDVVFRTIALVGVAVPVFWLGMMMQYIFSVNLRLLPAVEYKTPWMGDPPTLTGSRIIDSLVSGNWVLLFDTLEHLIMPSFCLTFISIAGMVRQTRSSMLEILQLDYIRTARAKGCKERSVINKHAFRNAIIPVVTLVGLRFAGLLGGAVLTETTFSLHGMGTLMIWAILGSNYNLINAIVTFLTIMFVAANLIVDVLYGVVDPRIRY